VTWFLCGLYSVALVAKILPGGVPSWIPESIQAVILIGLVLSHVYHGEAARPGRYGAAAVFAFLGTARYFFDSRGWFGAVALGEAAGLVAAGLLLHHKGYWAVGAVETFASAGIFVEHLPRRLPLAGIALTAGLLLFMIGILVTIHKETILDWMNPPRAPQKTSGPGDGPPPGAEFHPDNGMS
jgi:hypothetical protein